MVRVRRLVPVLLLLVALPAFAAEKSTRPPKGLRLLGDHWTPYNPPDPATFPPGSKVHIIEKGDTLWDLAGRFYNSNYLWPQLWEANTYITDAHWIYPGDPLLIQGETATGESGITDAGVGVRTGIDAAGMGETAAGGEEDMTASLAGNAGAAEESTFPLGVEADIYCYGYLSVADEVLPNRISSFEDVETKYVVGAREQANGVSTGDLVYIDGGTTTGLVAGETYLLVEPQEKVYHPRSGDEVGQHYDFRGRVRILCASDNRATGIITQACKDIHVGARLKPFPDIPIPLARLTPMATICTPPSGKTSGYIVNARDGAFALGEGHLVEINLGRDDLVQPGDFLTVYRDSPVKGGPRLLLGEMGVLTAEAGTATAKIVRMRYSMQVGDRVELK